MDALDQIRLVTEQRTQHVPLTLDGVAAGITTTYRNARHLLDDARLLAENDRTARATALTILALEELSKIPDFHDGARKAAAGSASAEQEWKEFWGSYTRHGAKLKRILSYGELIREGYKSGDYFNPTPYKHQLPESMGACLNLLKQRCLYVDHFGGDFISLDEADERNAAFFPGLAAIVDLLFAVAEERADSYRAWHLNVARTKELLDLTGPTRGFQATFREVRRGELECQIPDGFAADLLYIANRATSHETVTYHFEFGEEAAHALNDAGAQLGQSALQMVLVELDRRMSRATLLLSRDRAFRMARFLIKVAISTGTGALEEIKGRYPSFQCMIEERKDADSIRAIDAVLDGISESKAESKAVFARVSRFRKVLRLMRERPDHYTKDWSFLVEAIAAYLSFDEKRADLEAVLDEAARRLGALNLLR